MQSGTYPEIKNACVFLASGIGNRIGMVRTVGTLGEILCTHDIGVVYGGGSTGLMGVLAHSVQVHQGRLLGVMPEFLEEREGVFGYGEHIVVKDMHQRKRTMFERSDAFLALPGGIGTLEEVVEMMTWAQLGRHQKPVVLVNIEGFWDPLIRLLEQMVDWAYVGYPGKEVRLLVANSVEEILPLLTGELACRILTTRKGNGVDHAQSAEIIARM